MYGSIDGVGVGGFLLFWGRPIKHRDQNMMSWLRLALDEANGQLHIDMFTRFWFFRKMEMSQFSMRSALPEGLSE